MLCACLHRVLWLQQSRTLICLGIARINFGVKYRKGEKIMEKKSAFVMKVKKKTHKEDPVDQANLDLHFVEAFISMLFEIDGDRHLDSLKPGTVSAMCLESKIRIERLKKFIEAIPIDTVKAA